MLSALRLVSLLLFLLCLCRPLRAESSIDGGSDGRSSSVVELSDANFERLTQASTGATTGDWLVEFYAPSVALANQPSNQLSSRTT